MTRSFLILHGYLGSGPDHWQTWLAARLRAAGEKTAVDAFHFVQTLRLKREGNRIRPGELNDIDRRVLKEAFRQATLLQARVRLDFGL